MARTAITASSAPAAPRVWPNTDLTPVTGGMRSASISSAKIRENALLSIFNGPDPTQPRDINLTTPRCFYQKVLECDANDLDAHLALALLDLAALTVDPEINAAFDEWEDYLDNFQPFETTPPTKTLRVLPGIPDKTTAFTLPIAWIQRSILAQTAMNTMQDVPQISRIQDIFVDEVMPYVVSGIAHLDPVIADENLEILQSYEAIQQYKYSQSRE